MVFDESTASALVEIVGQVTFDGEPIMGADIIARPTATGQQVTMDSVSHDGNGTLGAESSMTPLMQLTKFLEPQELDSWTQESYSRAQESVFGKVFT